MSNFKFGSYKNRWKAREFERRKEAHEGKKLRIKKLADEADQSLEKFEAIR